MSDNGSTHAAGDGEQTRRRPAGRPRRIRDDTFDERYMDERGQDEREMVDDRELAEDERLELFLTTQHQTVLPNLPVQEGYHVCWLTTSNPRDSLQWRLSIGYELIRVEDCPGWQGIGSQSGNYSGVVSVNEMVAARVPITLYNKFMKAVGDTLPLKDEEALHARTSELRHRARQMNVLIEEGDGTADIVQRAGPMPVFTE